MIMAEADWSRVLEPELIAGLGFVLILFGFFSFCVWTSSRKTRLKDKMVERGFTAAEIKEVMDAGKS